MRPWKSWTSEFSLSQAVFDDGRCRPGSSFGNETPGFQTPNVGLCHPRVAGLDVARDAVGGFLSSYLGSVRGANDFSRKMRGVLVNAEGRERERPAISRKALRAKACARILGVG